MANGECRMPNDESFREQDDERTTFDIRHSEFELPTGQQFAGADFFASDFKLKMGLALRIGLSEDPADSPKFPVAEDTMKRRLT